MRLLGSVPLGRIVFTARALPAIRLVCHLVDRDYIVFRVDSGVPVISAIRSAAGSVVAYEADAVDLSGQLGWAVTVVGVARRVTDPAEATRYRQALRPPAKGTPDQVIAIHADLVKGFRMAAAGVRSDHHGSARGLTR
jgi:hypothetical protein